MLFSLPTNGLDSTAIEYDIRVTDITWPNSQDSIFLSKHPRDASHAELNSTVSNVLLKMFNYSETQPVDNYRNQTGQYAGSHNAASTKKKMRYW